MGISLHRRGGASRRASGCRRSPSGTIPTLSRFDPHVGCASFPSTMSQEDMPVRLREFQCREWCHLAGLRLHAAHGELPGRFDEETQGRRASCAAGEVEEVAGYGRRVALEHHLEASRAQLLDHHRLESVSESEATLRERNAERAVVGDDTSANRHAPGPAPALQFPRVERAGRARKMARLSSRIRWTRARPR
jgi:hypothetical protein